MAAYVPVVLKEDDEPVELPTEDDGTLLLSVVQSQFEGASGLKFRNLETSTWRALRISGDGVLQPPAEGWEHYKYVVVAGKPQQQQQMFASVSEEKERREERVIERDYREREPIEFGVNRASSRNDEYSISGGSESRPYGDLIVLGLKWEVTEDELKTYFNQYGIVDYAEIKYDSAGKSKGFGFLRFKSIDIQDSVMRMTHTIRGRRCELKHPRKSPGAMPCKFFVGCLPNNPEATAEELRSYFSRFGRLSDVYIPKPYRGFGFVTFTDGYDAQKMNSNDHSLRGYKLNVSIAEPKGKQGASVGGANQTQTIQGVPPQLFAAANYSLVSPQSSSYQPVPPPPVPHPNQGGATFSTNYMHGYGQPSQRYI